MGSCTPARGVMRYEKNASVVLDNHSGPKRLRAACCGGEFSSLPALNHKPLRQAEQREDELMCAGNLSNVCSGMLQVQLWECHFRL